jgi:secondary thiamine-phosphate synthase enzyme
MKEFTIRTNKHAEFLEITDKLQEAVDESGIKEGVCVAVVPHTTAGITINENADPDVVADMIYALDKAIPWKDPHYQHSEGNTAAHIKSSLMGHSVQVIVRGGRLQFGTWQGVYFCEFDGPRSRNLWVTVIGQ